VKALGAEHVLDSRSLAFVDEVRAITGDGVDIVLNSLFGEAMERSTVNIAAQTRGEDMTALIGHLRSIGQLNAGLILRALKNYKLPHALRMTVGTEEANRLVVAALAEFMGQK